MKKLFIVLLLFSFAGTFAQKAGQPAHSGRENTKILPVLWQQTAAEYRALCYQAFNLATLRINEIPEKELREGNLAIITDLDETVLDNSYNEAQAIIEHRQFSSAAWKEWVKTQSAPALPGAVEFLHHVHAKGIAVFYISNRDTSEVKFTLENLKRLTFPDAEFSHLLFKNNNSSKEPRRQDVMKKYKVVLLLGDNLIDFTPAFEKKSIADRKTEVDRMKDEWGKTFIVLPNSTYGEWENALYNYQHKLTEEQRDSIRTSLLKGFGTK